MSRRAWLKVGQDEAELRMDSRAGGRGGRPVGVLYSSVRNAPATEAQPQQKEAPPPKGPGPFYRLLPPCKEILERLIPVLPTVRAPSWCYWSQPPKVQSPPDENLLFVIATLPDPVHTVEDRNARIRQKE